VTPEQWMQGIGVAVAAVLLMAGAFWWGYEVRERLALKLEFFGISDRNWRRHDKVLADSPRRRHLPRVGRRPKATVHHIHEERESAR
jgi:hypothetical protein